MSIQVHDDSLLPDQNQDHIRALFRRESSHTISSFSIVNRLPPLKHIQNRSRVLKWYYEVVGYYQYDRCIIPISMDFLDRFLLLNYTKKELSPRTYKVVAMTSLYLAIKLHVGDVCSKSKLCLKEYASLGERDISPEDISSMEGRILNKLNWKVHPANPMCFVRHFLKLIEPSKEINDLSDATITADCHNQCIIMDICMEAISSIALYFTELAICMPETSTHFNLHEDEHYSMDRHTFAPSTLAYTCILLSMEMISSSVIPLNIREIFLRKCNNLCHSGKHGPLRPDRKDINELQNRIRNNFTLDKCLNQAAAKEGRPYRCISQTEPVATAIYHGFLNSHFLEYISISYDPVETFTTENLDDAPIIPRRKRSSINRHMNYSSAGHIPSSTTKRKSISCADRQGSPTSIMECDMFSYDLPGRKRIRRV